MGTEMIQNSVGDNEQRMLAMVDSKSHRVHEENDIDLMRVPRLQIKFIF